MLKSDRSIRFTATEIKELAELGLDVSSANSAARFAAALGPWLDALAQVRPDLFEKIGRAIAAAKGVQLPLEHKCL